MAPTSCVHITWWYIVNITVNHWGYWFLPYTSHSKSYSHTSTPKPFCIHNLCGPCQTLALYVLAQTCKRCNCWPKDESANAAWRARQQQANWLLQNSFPNSTPTSFALPTTGHKFASHHTILPTLICWGVQDQSLHYTKPKEKKHHVKTYSSTNICTIFSAMPLKAIPAQWLKGKRIHHRIMHFTMQSIGILLEPFSKVLCYNNQMHDDYIKI